MKSGGEKIKTVEEIKAEIKIGDIYTIHKMTGFTTDYIGMVLGKRRKSEKVLEAATILLNAKAKLIKDFPKKITKQ